MSIMLYTQINYQKHNIDKMFKKILEELNRTKKLMNLTESEQEIKTVIFGDDVIDYIDDKDVTKIQNLSDENLTIDKLITKLKSEVENPEVDYLFLSIGKNDNFEDSEKIGLLTSLIKSIFPNAKLNIIRPIISSFEMGDFNNDLKEYEKIANLFYNDFYQYGFNPVGSYRILDGERVGVEKKIKSLKDEILDRIVKDVNKEQPKLIDQVVSFNEDIIGEDETDFDTIYEFLNRFEKITNSDNVYQRNMSSSFKPDVEQIQIALKFVDPSNSDLEINGKFDYSTERAIYNFQKKNNLLENGIADPETLEELFYEIKIKGFDEKDLSKFIKELESESGYKYSTDKISGKDITGKTSKTSDSQSSDSLVDSGETSKSAGTKSDDERIYKAILNGVGADDTEENMLFFHAWRKGEGGTATFNPFNTTQPFNDASKYNSHGVRNYKTEDDGIKATIKTLKNGYYPCVLDGLRRNIGAKNISKNCLANLKKWGTGALIFKVLNRGDQFTPPPIYRKNDEIKSIVKNYGKI